MQALILNLMMAFAMAWTVWGWSRGTLSPGDLVLVNTYLLQLFRPLDMLGWVYRTIRQGLIDMADMFRLLDTKAEVEDAPGAPALIVRRPMVTFENVSFGYDKDRQILHGLSFEAPAGAHVALVGPSGAGKSTIGRLLFRFYDPWEGRICIDGQDIRAVTQESLRRAIGIVPQDTVLFNDTIGYNIAYGRDEAAHEQVRQAAADAAILPFILGLPQGLRYRSGRARAETVGRGEAARRHCPHPAQEPADPAAGRSHQRARFAHRTGNPRHAAAGDRRTHHPRHRPPALDDCRCRFDQCHGCGPDCASKVATTRCCGWAGSTPKCGTASRTRTARRAKRRNRRRAMRVLVIAGLALVAACVSVPSSDAYFVREGMVQHINPPTEAIWNMQVEVMDDEGNFDPALMDDAKWATLTANAAQLDQQAQRMAVAQVFIAANPAGDLTHAPEGTDLAAIQARLDANPQAYRAFAQALAGHSAQLHAAVLARDAARLTALVNDLQPVCKACHDVFWYPEEYAN